MKYTLIRLGWYPPVISSTTVSSTFSSSSYNSKHNDIVIIFLPLQDQAHKHNNTFTFMYLVKLFTCTPLAGGTSVAESISSSFSFSLPAAAGASPLDALHFLLFLFFFLLFIVGDLMVDWVISGSCCKQEKQCKTGSPSNKTLYNFLHCQWYPQPQFD